MRSTSRFAAALAVALAMSGGGGCGQTLYDAAGVPVLVPTCTGDTPLYCASVNACFAEDASRCGTACARCPAVANGSAFCDITSPDLTQHACTFQCDASFVRSGSSCVCPGGTNVCGAETSCNAESTARCGAGCVPCAAPANGSATCSAGACGIACNATFAPDGIGGCACPGGTNACGGATTCTQETVAACGPNCVTCAAPAHAAAGCGQGACGFTCDLGFRNNPLGSGCVCNVGTNLCGAETQCQPQTTARCGDTCAVCTAAPAHASPICDAIGGHCDFACATGFQKSLAGDACVCSTPGQVTCGGGVGGTCVNEGIVAACGPTCATCTAPTGPWGSATPVCSASACDYSCPSNQPVKCTNSGTGLPDCCPSAGCTSAEVACGAAGACVLEDADHCGNGVPTANACIVCPAAPAGAARACNASTGHLCDFTCPAGTFKNKVANACERVGAGVSDVALGGKHSCIVTEPSRSVFCWGANDKGQLGDGTTSDRTAPVHVLLPTGATVRALAAGQAHTCAVFSDAARAGQVWCWGSNAAGQLADAPSPTPVLAPVRAATFLTSTTALVPLALGAGHTCAINAAGGVACWGANALGQLGDGKGVASAAPVATGILAGATWISSSFDTTCAVVGGNVRCWGANDRGQVGNGVQDAAGQKSPAAAVPGIGVVTAVAVGQAHACVINSAGSVPFCWGDNSALQLANRVLNRAPPTAISLVPVDGGDIVGKNGGDLISAGAHHTCAAATLDPVTKCAGDSGTGFLPAVGTTGTSPVDAGGIAGQMQQLFSGSAHECTVMLPTFGTALELWCWGINDRGQFGNGSTSAAPNTAPVRPNPQ